VENDAASEDVNENREINGSSPRARKSSETDSVKPERKVDEENKERYT
jgi:hypothetical protein